MVRNQENEKNAALDEGQVTETEKKKGREKTERKHTELSQLSTVIFFALLRSKAFAFSFLLKSRL